MAGTGLRRRGLELFDCVIDPSAPIVARTIGQTSSSIVPGRSVLR